ncbi:hypothetical protein MIND_00942600 [Mycena indigotica]|uniref:EKC/KEOPS complex subunit CGI121 n=1 Tax=Mycena indigotica TaxID=2126181 RepID=A0A8H6SDS6_9AGAR|nr:uncharacterized protein MIND_00942600 [Mycena indigotica]KAF7297097.1 hypothetical protein MIND_00942600 [Mycena indigotica]
MESYQLLHLPPELSHIHIALYTNVSNSAVLKKRLIAAASAEGEEGERERDAVNFAFIDARLVRQITSLRLLKTAIYSATLAASQERLLTKTVHSEILWTLNPTNNISEAIRRYGVSETSTSLVLVRVAGPELSRSELQLAMGASIEGTVIPLERLGSLTDWTAVKKYHKLGNETALRGATGLEEREHIIIDEIVISSAAMKSVQA